MDTASGAAPSRVMLFYDGYELAAEERLAAHLKGVARRHARAWYRTLTGKQVKTGFYTWFEMLCRALRSVGAEVLVNDFAAARRAPEQPICAAGYHSVLGKLRNLPNPRIVGPGLYGSPLENPTLFDDPKNIIFLMTCDWQTEMFRPWFKDRMRPWFGGFDVRDFNDAKDVQKQWDVLIYDKIYFNRDHWYDRSIGPFIKMIEGQGLRYHVIRYGQYHLKDYIQAVQKSACMAFFAHSETQGMAYQECLCSNVPVFAWNEGIWPHPSAKDISDKPIPCNSVPYFSPDCGVTFTAQTMAEQWSRFRAGLGAYSPRRFMAEELSLQKSAEAYLRVHREVSERTAAGARPI